MVSQYYIKRNFIFILNCSSPGINKIRPNALNALFDKGMYDVLFILKIKFSNNFPCPLWGEWYALSNCTTSCSRIRQVPTSKALYKETGLMVESRNCTNERNHFNCKDYARTTTDKDPLKLENVRQDVICNQNIICSGG